MPTQSRTGGQIASWNEWYQNTYLKAIEKYKGTQYYQQLLDNPYAQYQHSGGTAIGNFLNRDATGHGWLLNALTFGLTGELSDTLNGTAQEQLDASRQQSAMEELSRIEGLMQENAYNSPSAQREREVAAGLNPDLVGLSSTPAADNPGPNETASPLMPGAAADQASQGIMQVGSIASQFVNGCMNMVRFFQETEARSQANAAGDIELLDSVYNTALKQAAGMSGLPSTREEYDALTEEEKLGADKTIYETLQAAVKDGSLGSMVLNRRAKSMLKKMTGRVMFDKDGKPTLAFQQQRAAMLKSFYGDTLEAGKAGGHPIMSDPEDFASVLEKSMKFFGDYENKLMEFQKKMLGIQERIANAQARSEEAGATSAEARSSYDEGMYSKELGETEAAGRKAIAEAEAASKELDSYLDKQLDSLMKELDGYGVKGKIAKIGLVSTRMLLKSLTMSLNPLSNKGQLTGFAPGFGLQ